MILNKLIGGFICKGKHHHVELRRFPLSETSSLHSLFPPNPPPKKKKRVAQRGYSSAPQEELGRLIWRILQSSFRQGKDTKGAFAWRCPGNGGKRWTPVFRESVAFCARRRLLSAGPPS